VTRKDAEQLYWAGLGLIPVPHLCYGEGHDDDETRSETQEKKGDNSCEVGGHGIVVCRRT